MECLGSSRPGEAPVNFEVVMDYLVVLMPGDVPANEDKELMLHKARMSPLYMDFLCSLLPLSPLFGVELALDSNVSCSSL